MKEIGEKLQKSCKPQAASCKPEIMMKWREAVGKEDFENYKSPGAFIIWLNQLSQKAPEGVFITSHP